MTADPRQEIIETLLDNEPDANRPAVPSIAHAEAYADAILTSFHAAGLSIEPTMTTQQMRAMLWYAWDEMNAIRAESGVPCSYDGRPKAINEEFWSNMVDAMATLLGDAAKPWPPDGAQEVFDALSRRREVRNG